MSKQRQPNLGWLNEQLARNRAADTSESIFPVSQATALKDQSGTQQVQMIAPERLLDNPYQTRVDYRNVDSLAEKIRTLGFRGSVLARPHPDKQGYYQLAFGHRRRRAAEMANVLVPVEVVELDNQQMILLALGENFEREDLTVLEEGEIFARMSEDFQMTQDEIAAFVGEGKKTKIARGYVRNRMGAAQLARKHPNVRQHLEQHPDTSLRALSYLYGDDLDERSIAYILQGLSEGWNADTVEKVANQLREGGEVAEQLFPSQTEVPEETEPHVASAPSGAGGTRARSDEIVVQAKGKERQQGNAAVKQISRITMLEDALKRFKNYVAACQGEAPSGEERRLLAELVSHSQGLLGLTED